MKMKMTMIVVGVALFSLAIGGIGYGQEVKKSAVPQARPVIVVPAVTAAPAAVVKPAAVTAVPAAAPKVAAPVLRAVPIAPAVKAAPTIMPLVTAPSVSRISAFDKAAILALIQQSKDLTHHLLKNDVSSSRLNMMTPNGEFIALSDKKVSGKFLITDIVFDRNKNPIEVAGIGKIVEPGTSEQQFGQIPQENTGAFSVKLSPRVTVGASGEFIIVTKESDGSKKTYYSRNPGTGTSWVAADGTTHVPYLTDGEKGFFGTATQQQIDSMMEADRVKSEPGGESEPPKTPTPSETPPSGGGNSAKNTCDEDDEEGKPATPSTPSTPSTPTPPDPEDEEEDDDDDGEDWPPLDDFLGSWVEFISDGTSLSVNVFKDRGSVSRLSTGSVSNWGESDVPVTPGLGPVARGGTVSSSPEGSSVPDGAPGGKGGPGWASGVGVAGVYKLNYWMLRDSSGGAAVSGMSAGSGSAAFGDPFGGLSGGVRPGGGDPLRKVKQFSCQVR